MPRTGRGGARSGTPGRAYGNRTDLNTGAGQAATAGDPRPYTEGGQPQPPAPSMPTGGGQAPTPTPGGGPAGPGGPGGPGGPAGLGGGLPPERQLAAPGDPDEPLTAGMPVGPGGGPEELGSFAPDQPTADMMQMARHLPMLELLVTSGAAKSQRSRTLLRMVKNSIPPDVREQLASQKEQSREGRDRG